MKQFLTLTVFLCCAGVAQARQPAKHAMHRQVLAMLQHNGCATNAMRTTSGTIMERVAAISKRDNTLHRLADSVAFVYSASHESQYDYNDMLYAYNYPYSTSPMFNYAGVFTKPQVSYDNMLHWEIDPNTLVYGFYEAGAATYDAPGNTTGFLNTFADSAITPNMLYANTFAAANNIATGSWSNWSAGAADSAFRQYFSYNSLNLLTMDSTYEYHLGSWHIVSKTFYAYDGSNNLTQIDNYANTGDTSFTLPLPEQLAYTSTYDASHRLLTVASSFNNGTALVPYVRDTFSYTGSYTWHTGWREYQWDAINLYWAPVLNMIKAINGAGRPDTVNIMGFDSLANAWVPQTMDIMHYDSYNNPDTLWDYDFNFTSFPSTPSFTTTYYYSTFFNTLSLPAPAETPVSIFPNPATQFVTVSMSNSAATTIDLLNIYGQVVSRTAAHAPANVQISLSGLPSGQYMLLLRDENGHMLSRQQIIKL